MEEIVLTHNGISYTKEDIIEMLDLVMEIVGEEVWSSDQDLNLTIILKNTFTMMMLILYNLTITAYLIMMMSNHAVTVGIVRTRPLPAVKMNTKWGKIMMSKKEPVRLYRADPRESILQNDIVIRFSFSTAIVLAFILFLLLCFWIVPATQGFYWWWNYESWWHIRLTIY